MDQQRAQALTQTGLDALRRGDAGGARTIFDQIAAEGGSPPWLAMAQACNMAGDIAGEETALQHQLDADMRNLPALLLMGELKTRQRDDRAAVSFYRTALAVAALSQSLPPQIQSLLQRAQAFLAEANTRYESHLFDQLADAGLKDGAMSPRIGAAVDLLLGRKQLYLQQPNVFYFPGLPQRQYYERAEFDWIGAVEAAVPDMQAELAAVSADDSEFVPYVAPTPGRPLPANHLLNDPSWGAYYLWQGGKPVEGHAARCPATMAALALAPMPAIAGRSPMALFSRLLPGTHIKPHHGMLNTRLVCHAPLVVPEGCAIRVGNETREWTEGEMLIFDDSFEHEAWNHGPRARTVLIFEIWRPEIGEAERAELTALFEAIDLFPQGDGPDA